MLIEQSESLLIHYSGAFILRNKPNVPLTTTTSPTNGEPCVGRIVVQNYRYNLRSKELPA